MPISAPQISFSKSLVAKVDTAIVFVKTLKTLPSVITQFDKKHNGFIAHHIAEAKKFKAGFGQFLTLTLPQAAPYQRLILVGIEDSEKKSVDAIENLGGQILVALTQQSAKKAAILNADDSQPDHLHSVILGLELGSYHYREFKTQAKDKAKPDEGLQTLIIVSDNDKDLAKNSRKVSAVADAVGLTRDLVNAPPNHLYPESFAAKIKKTLTPLGVKVKILDDEQIKKLGMGCLYAVGQASENPPRLVLMEWNGTTTKKTSAKKSTAKPLAFVGKGITFDSGGLNVKPYEGMMDMKMDMGGAASVVGLMQVVASLKVKQNIVGVVALAENSISDEATRPSDIVTSYSGKTVEILNTDAEGRLVLADALTYVQEKYNPAIIVDLATLTGAIMVALGLNHAGAFVNHDGLWQQLDKASVQSGEKLWRMPLHDSFRRDMDSVFADIKNIGNGRYGGSCTAAAFLGEFIDAGRVWAHLDIAGVAMSKTTPTCPVPFASGYGVKLLTEFVEAYNPIAEK